MIVKLATYNIQFGYGQDGRYDLARIAAAETCVLDGGGLARLDYMFTTPDLSGNIRSARVDRTNKSSDHYPVYFTLEV